MDGLSEKIVEEDYRHTIDIVKGLVSSVYIIASGNLR